MSQIQPQPGILDIAVYQGGHGPARTDAVLLAANENPAGPPASAVAAAAQAAASLHRYPSSDHAALRAALGARHGLDPARIICGAGSDEIIAWLAAAYAGPGLEVLYPRYGFLMYRIAALAAGATPVIAEEDGRTVSPGALIAAATPATRLIFVADPANPTGTRIGPAALEAVARAVPQALLVIDAAYADYVEGCDGGAALAARLPNVLMTRTFSKLYGLGGARVGWAFGPQPVIDVLNRMRGPYNISAPSLAAAEAALADTDYEAQSRADNARRRAALTSALRRAGIAVDDSATNFVLARFADAATARAADAALAAEGLIVRSTAGYGLPEALRITIGLDADCARVAQVLTRFMEARA